MNVSGLDITSNNEFYILKLKDNSFITNLAGEAVSSPYICLCRAAMGSKTIAARETEYSTEATMQLRLTLTASYPQMRRRYAL